MHVIRSSPVLLAVALWGCGGSQTQENVRLQGTWYFQTTDVPPELVGRHVITQGGNEVLITYCNRSTYALEIKDGMLVDSGGQPYYLQPDGPGRLVGPSDNGATSRAVRVSDATVFDSGSLSVLAEGFDDLDTFRDVCAEQRTGHFVALDETAVDVPTVTITAPYGSSFVRIRAAFHSLAPGSYTALDLDAFVHTPTGAVYLEMESPDYGDAFADAGAVSIADGTVAVTSADSGSFSFEGFLTTPAGKMISYSGTVVPGS